MRKYPLSNALQNPLVWAALAFVYGALLLSVCSDWVGFIVDEGFTLYGASRMQAGELPYRDFFFLWTPGILYWQRLCEAAGAFFGLAPLWAGRWGVLPFGALLVALAVHHTRLQSRSLWAAPLAGALAILWGTTLWNMPYASWNAAALAWLALTFFRRIPWLAGAILALAFWFKQNIGCGALAMLAIFLLWKQDWKTFGKILGGFALLLLPGFLYFAAQGALQAFLWQVFYFPWVYREVMFLALPWRSLLSPRGFFFVFPILLVAAHLYARIRGENKQGLFLYGFLTFGIYYQVYPRFDFQHFLFVFAILLPPLFALAEAARKELRWLAGLCVVLLGLTGAAEQSGLWRMQFAPEHMLDGVKSRGLAAQLNREVEEVRTYLRTELGLKAGDPLLILPHEETIYALGGFRNLTPHNQFLPQYVEAFGDAQNRVLRQYREAGGKYVLLGYRPVLERAAPELANELQSRYQVRRKFPFYFAVWEPKN